MNRGEIRVLDLGGGPVERGRAHGIAYPDEIRRYTAERVRLAGNGSWAGRPASIEDVLGLAEEMLPAHQEYAPDLYAEMVAMAEAAGITAAEAVIVGGFTDFVDVVRARGGTGLPEEDDCTAVIVPGSVTDGAGFLAQTWDMTDTATEHVILLRNAPDGDPQSLIFTTVGCLGQIGLNEAGIAVGINNLSAADGRVGVTWPFVIRKVLQQTDIESALECLTSAPLAGGHNYLILDADGRGYDVEAMPGCRHVAELDSEPLVHTNHALDADVARHEAPRPDDLLESSVARYAAATTLLEQRPVTVDTLIALTREPGAICRRSTAPHYTESSGAAIMRPATGEMWACWGIPADNEFRSFAV